MEELTEENCDLKMAKEKLEDELNEKKRAAEGIEFVSLRENYPCHFPYIHNSPFPSFSRPGYAYFSDSCLCF